MTYKGGRPFETYMPITANDTIICSNILGEKGTWKVSLEARTIFGNIILRKGISVSNASYFRFTPRELTAWGDALIRRDDNGNPYTIGEIEFRMGNSTTRWDIRFEVWPNRPKIISASFNYDDFV